MENVEELKNKVRFLYKTYFGEDMPELTEEEEMQIKNNLKIHFIVVSEEDFSNCVTKSKRAKNET